MHCDAKTNAFELGFVRCAERRVRPWRWIADVLFVKYCDHDIKL